MTEYVIAWLLMAMSLPAHLDGGRCSTCKMIGWKSTVGPSIEMMCFVTTADICPPGRYDEDGIWREPECNKIKADPCPWRCSRGHVVREWWKGTAGRLE
jgi:hypothetical protein